MGKDKSKEKERLQILSRLGRETIIKNGTYDVQKARRIDPDHPEKNDEDRIPYDMTEDSTQESGDNGPVNAEPVNNEPVSDEDASALAEQILSNNFKVGMSQSDVDSFLNGMI
ncbi:MAG: hypothetical protein J5518_08755 [Lachnospiraceae bacterium]|nr:hypothetical protein [Lachnospiraceae bacterium]